MSNDNRHACPWTLGQLLAFHAVLKCAGHERLAQLALAHSRQHEPETRNEGEQA